MQPRGSTLRGGEPEGERARGAGSVQIRRRNLDWQFGEEKQAGTAQRSKSHKKTLQPQPSVSRPSQPAPTWQRLHATGPVAHVRRAGSVFIVSCCWICQHSRGAVRWAERLRKGWSAILWQKAQTRTPLAPSPVPPYAEAYQERADITAAEILPSCASHRGCFQNRGRGTQRCDQREGFIEVSCGSQSLGLFPDQLCACMAGAAQREREGEHFCMAEVTADLTLGPACPYGSV